MSVIVCNAGPLIALSGVGVVELLRDLFGAVYVAEEVKCEVELGGALGVGMNLFREHTWLRVTPTASKVNPMLASLLDAGEAATITLAHEMNASLVLLDEAKGRKIAGDVYHLPVIGTGRVLVEAKKRGLISAVKPLLDEMRSRGYWINTAVYGKILDMADEPYST
jgi:predicted nucleic acid-binding protein